MITQHYSGVAAGWLWYPGHGHPIALLADRVPGDHLCPQPVCQLAALVVTEIQAALAAAELRESNPGRQGATPSGALTRMGRRSRPARACMARSSPELPVLVKRC